MNKLLKTLALVLVLTMCMSVVASAATTATGVNGVASNDKADVTISADGTTVTFAAADSENMQVDIASSALIEGSQYLILVVSGDGSVISKDTILYIDQDAAGAGGTLSFNVYPSSIKDSVILITGVADGQLKLAVIDARYILGDANGDTFVDVRDIMRIANIILGTAEPTPAADANEDTYYDVRDIMRVANIILGKV